ncbi:type III-A CRISPR-associated RAMP protein Csm3 [Mangrovibacterium sp.]|uniref:type III-A CRISPR-associated RAMP protein Csm3 n=1 Tax=Mangrovibacterium sp. TaxID=1961364 RepID=UPI003561D552
MTSLVKKIKISSVIILKTGLHIGGTNSSLNIGGPDKFVVRNPLTNIPYIPGSSLKGKMRSLLELNEGTIHMDKGNFGPTKDTTTKAGALFGTIGDQQQPSRIIVRDAELISDLEEFNNTDLPYTESKTEVAIDRITARSNPRTFERVPAGARFRMEMILNVFDTDDEAKLVSSLKQALKLLEDDYLGGHGSRGYGQIGIEKLSFEERDRTYYAKN